MLFSAFEVRNSRLRNFSYDLLGSRWIGAPGKLLRGGSVRGNSHRRALLRIGLVVQVFVP